jgi:hypothetical protein
VTATIAVAVVVVVVEKDRWRTLVSTVMSLRVRKRRGIYRLAERLLPKDSRKLHGVSAHYIQENA